MCFLLLWSSSQGIAGDPDLGTSFWVLTAVGLACTLGISVYSTRLYQRLAAEEEAAELAAILEKKRLGEALAPREHRALWKEERRLRETGDAEKQAMVGTTVLVDT